MNQAKYLSYRPSGTTWFDEVPEHWQVNRLKNVATYRVSNVDKVPSDNEEPVRLCNYTDVYYNEHVHLGLDLMRTTATTAEIRRFGLRVNDVVITKDSEEWSDIAVPALVTETSSDFVCGYHLAIIRPDPRRMHGPFLLRLLQAQGVNIQMQLAANGITRYSLPKSAIGEALLPIPPIDEQRAISDFLTRETARIDDLIGMQYTLLNAIKEAHEEIVTSTVTAGAGERIRCGAGSSATQSELPPNWRAPTVRYLLLMKRIAIQDGNHGELHPTASDYVAGGIPFIMASDLKLGEIDLKECKFITEDRARALRIGFSQPLDVLLSHKGTLGEVAMVPENLSAPFLMLTPQVTYYRSIDQSIRPRYLYHLLSSRFFRRQLDYLAAGQATRAYVGILAQRDLVLLLPPAHEQEAIASKLDAAEKRMKLLARQTGIKIKLLGEQRKAAVSAAVTGQINLCSDRPQEVAASCQ